MNADGRGWIFVWSYALAAVLGGILVTVIPRLRSSRRPRRRSWERHPGVIEPAIAGCRICFTTRARLKAFLKTFS